MKFTHYIKQLCVAFALICITTSATAQQKVIDSLQQLLQTSKPDTIRVWLYLRIGSSYRNINLQKGHAYLDSAWQLSNQLQYKTGMLKYGLVKCALFRVEGNNDSCFSYNKKQLALARQFNDTVNIGIAYLNLADSYNDFSDAETALATALQGLAIVEKANDAKLKQQTYDVLMRLYSDRTEYDKALGYGVKAAELARQLGVLSAEAQALINMANIYNSKKDFKASINASEKAATLSRTDGNERFEAYALSNLGDVYLKLGDIGKAKMYCERSLLLAQNTGDKSMTATELLGLAMCSLQTKNYQQAKWYADSALVINKEMDDAENIIQTTKVLADVAFAMGDPAQGYAYEQQCDDYEAAHIKQVLSKQSSDLEKKYQTAAKETKISELEAEKKVQQLAIERKNILNMLLICSAIVLLVTGGLFYQNYKNKQKLQQQRITELETEKQLAATEAVLKGEENERARLAKDLHDGLGGMLSGIKYSLNTMKGNLIMTPGNAQAFERSIDMLDSSIQEMRRVAHNMMPEALVKFGLDVALSDFCNSINQTGALKVHYQSLNIKEAELSQITAITLYRIIQELVNNVMRHANAANVIVQLSKVDDKISITVEDDGNGFNTAILDASKGIGWSNIQNRVEYVKGNIDVRSESGKGTSVHIELPIA